MNQSEKEYQEFMMKLSKKANEVRRDFDNLSEENKERIRNDVSYLAIIELLKITKSNY